MDIDCDTSEDPTSDSLKFVLELASQTIDKMNMDHTTTDASISEDVLPGLLQAISSARLPLPEIVSHDETAINSNDVESSTLDDKESTPQKMSSEFLGLGDPQDCTKCDFRTVFKKFYLGHMALHRQPQSVSTDTPFGCPLCPYICSEEKFLSPHLASHPSKPDIRVYCCLHCSFASKSEVLTDNHYAEEHSDLDNRMNVTFFDPDDTFDCTFCPSELDTECELVEHVRSEHNTIENISQTVDWLKTLFNFDVMATQQQSLIPSAKLTENQSKRKNHTDTKVPYGYCHRYHDKAYKACKDKKCWYNHACPVCSRQHPLFHCPSGTSDKSEGVNEKKRKLNKQDKVTRDADIDKEIGCLICCDPTHTDATCPDAQSETTASMPSCPTPGCNGKGNVRPDRAIHVSQKACPLYKQQVLRGWTTPTTKIHYQWHSNNSYA